MYHLRVPTTEQELKDYYQFRWEMLRKPLHQPIGSEKDAYDAMAHHQMVVDEQGKPVAIMMHTAMGKGVDFMEGTHEWHGIAPNDEQLAKALAQLPETLGDY